MYVYVYVYASGGGVMYTTTNNSTWMPFSVVCFGTAGKMAISVQRPILNFCAPTSGSLSTGRKTISICELLKQGYGWESQNGILCGFGVRYNFDLAPTLAAVSWTDMRE